MPSAATPPAAGRRSPSEGRRVAGRVGAAGAAARLGRTLRLPSVIAAAALVAAGCLPAPATDQARAVSGLYTLFVIAAIPVGLLVWGIATVALVRYRARPGDAAAGRPEPPQTHGSTRLELLWTAGPIALRARPAGRHDRRPQRRRREVARAVGFGPGHRLPLGLVVRLRRDAGRRPGRRRARPRGRRPCGRDRPHHAPCRGRGPRVLRAGLPVQARRHPGTRVVVRDLRRPARQLRRPMRRVLRRRAQPDAVRDPGGVARRLRRMAGAGRAGVDQASPATSPAPASPATSPAASAQPAGSPNPQATGGATP